MTMPALVIFDLDGTLTESKRPLSDEMAHLFTQLLARTRVAIISGGALPQFLTQVTARLPGDAHVEHLYLLPTSGAALYEWDNGGWDKIYEERIPEHEASAIAALMLQAAKETGTIDFSEPAWGERIEYRGAQLSLSALGQQAPLAEKKAWDPDKTKRRVLRAAIAARLPADFSAAMGGMTTIDVTKKGIDKAYGIRQLCKRLKLEETNVLYIGDELAAGGNDEAVFTTHAQVHPVSAPADTERVILSLLALGS